MCVPSLRVGLSSSTERVGRGLELRKIGRLLVGGHWVGGLLPVDELAHHVGVTGVLGRLGDHAYQQVTERRLKRLGTPPGDGRRRGERQLGDRGVALLPPRALEVEDVVARLLRLRPHVGAVPHGSVVVPRQDDG